MQLHVHFKLRVLRFSLRLCHMLSELWVFGRCRIFGMFTSLFPLICQTGTVLTVATPPLYDATPHVTRPAGKERDTQLEGAQITGLLLRVCVCAGIVYVCVCAIRTIALSVNPVRPRFL